MSEPSSGKTVVLIVEDEPIIRMNASDYVSETGYAALEAATGDEALAILCERDDIDVVFTDVNLPGKLDGIELSHLIAARWPRIAIIITSGKVRPDHNDPVPHSMFLPKPYTLQRVVDSIKGMAC